MVAVPFLLVFQKYVNDLSLTNLDH